MSEAIDVITEETEVSTTELACVLGITGRRIRQMAEDGQLQKVSKGRFLLADSVQRYVKFLSDGPMDEEDKKLAEKRKSDKIIKYLDSADAEVVVAALKALSDIKDEDSVNSIAGMIDNENDEIRKEAACALGEIGSEYAKTYLQHRMTTEKNEEVKTVSGGREIYH